MNRIKKLKLIIMLVFIMCFSGCWDSKKLENLSIPIAAGYELVEETGTGKKQMDIYAVIPVFYKNTPQKYIIDITMGDLIGETRTKRMGHLGEEISLGSFQVGILGKKLAAEGARDAVNILTRTPQIKQTVNLAVAEGDIKDIFHIVPDNYPNVGVYLDTLLDNAFKQSFTPESNLHTFSISMDTPGWHPVAPMLKAQNNKIFISKYAIFKDDKLACTITLSEARILEFLRGLSAAGRWTYSFMYKDSIPITASVNMKNKTKIKVTRSSKGYNFEVKVDSKGSIVELLPNENLKSLDSALLTKENLLNSETLLSDVEKGYEEFIKKEINALIYKAQNEFRMDIFNWVRFAQAKWRRELEDVDWDELFSQADVSVNVKVNIKYIGEQT